ncbi:MAG: N-acetylglucosamine-6-phosphate deacetylase [Planctomycetaceae bacterium]|nr:N-acetylglucosamine-6-phosphate deacetylase [Planctomycetaceae bacterium]
MTTITARCIETGKPLRVRMAGTQLSEVTPTDVDSVDSLPWIAPGLFDIQLNGYRGRWFSSETLTVDDVRETLLDLAAQGIAECFPTLVTNSNEAIEHGMNTIRKACDADPVIQAMVPGIHLEGPWISPLDGPRGAHPLEHVRMPIRAEFESWQRASGGRIRLVTLAPEVEGAVDAVAWLTREGIVVSIGHTAADAVAIQQAVKAGAGLSTHLGNGAAGLLPRHPNLLWEQLAEDRLWASVISDGHHLPQSTLLCMTRCKTLGRMIITCDVSGFGGCPPGEYREGGLAAEVLADGRIVSAGQRQYLAGSGATTGECVIRFAQMCDVSLAEAWSLACQQPNRLFQRPAPALEANQPATLTVFRLQTPAPDLPAIRFAGQSGSLHVSTAATFAPVATFVQGRQTAGPSDVAGN